MHIVTRCFYLWVLAFSVGLHASVVAPDDGPYYRLRKDRTLYIYDATARDLVDQLAAYNEPIRAMYDQSFGWKLDEEMDLLLTSPKQQVANAYATVAPNIKTVWYPSGAALTDELAVSSWLLLLNAHEVSHLYQFNAKGPLNSALKSVLGNSFVLVFPLSPLLPVFIHPNFLTPTFMMEGNATFNESRLNLGGRLHSGEKRALVLAQIAAHDIDPTRMINDGFRFPFGEEPYMQGAYFQAHLAAKYGVEKTNQFFVAQGRHYFWPLILNKTFRDHFGSSYAQEIREYVRNMEGLASKQQRTEGLPYIRTTFAGEMNHDANRIFFLTTEAKQPPLLHVFDKAKGTMETRQLDLPSGKVFFDGPTPLVAASEQHDLHHTEYSLYGEANRLDPRYRGQIVNDIRAGKTASLDAADSWAVPKLLVNGEPYDVSQSRPILDDKGNVYYFRQNGTERIVYRNREPLAKFEGFYGKPMEVTEDGTFYFIGSTDYGSTLYRLRGREISRVLASDRVIDARRIGGEDFLVTEVTNMGHEILLAHAEPNAQTPAVYSYGFPNVSLIPAKPGQAETVAKDERPYNSLGQMRYNSLDIETGYSGFGLMGSANASFSDPLEYQAFSLGFVGSQFGDRQAKAEYTFTKYLPDFFVSYLYQDDRWTTSAGTDRYAHDQTVIGGVHLPVLRWRHWDASVKMALTYQNEDQQRDPYLAPTGLPGRYEQYGVLSAASVQYALAPGLGFHPWRGFNLNYKNWIQTGAERWTKGDNTSLLQTRYVHGLPEEFYVTLAANYAWAESNDIKVGYEQATLSEDIRIPSLTSHEEEYQVRNAGSVRLEITSARTIPLYSARIPIGLNRVAPVVVGQGIFMDRDPLGVYPPNTFEWGWGADLDLLLLHKMPVRMRFLNSYDTRSPIKTGGEMDARLSYRMSF